MTDLLALLQRRCRKLKKTARVSNIRDELALPKTASMLPSVSQKGTTGLYSSYECANLLLSSAGSQKLGCSSSSRI